MTSLGDKDDGDDDGYDNSDDGDYDNDDDNYDNDDYYGNMVTTMTTKKMYSMHVMYSK